jgi:peptidoglycan/LPS O-acetylase OafA/YrhL
MILSGRIPCLDGLRAFAILCVIASHSVSHLPGAWSIGHFGVTAFFVISGFLITTLLIRARERTGTISISQVYLRRVPRIVPAYLSFLAVIALLAAFGRYRIDARSWIAALTYTSCFTTLSTARVLAHTWSLFVEENFYILWPLLFQRSRTTQAVVWLVVFAALAPFVRWVGLLAGREWLDPNYSSPSQIGSIAIGCLLALFLTRDRPASPLAWATGAFAAIAASLMLRDQMLRTAAADTLRAVAFAMIITAVLHLTPSNPIYRLLNSKLLMQIGVLSYGLYLWQQPLTDWRVPPLVSVPLLADVAALSYYVIERPFLRLKERVHADGLALNSLNDRSPVRS